MAKFELELPNDIIKEVENLENNCEKMLQEMTRAGAEKVLKNIQTNIPNSFKTSEIMKCLKVTKSYKTGDGGINTKVAFYGYFKNKRGVETPAPLVANVFEHGNSTGTVKKTLFLRKSFNKKQIEQEMLKIEEKYLPKE